jgi:beta-lactamase regulating signal transducer with metallopeptidase domain
MPTQIHENGNLTISNVVRTAKTYFPITYKTDLLSRIFNVAAMIWVIVAFGAILLMMLLYYLSYKELCKATLVDGVLYTSNGVNSPIVHGILKQKVIIPCNLKDNKEELKYVILHEGVHIKRHDNLIRVIAIITACIHWFNPFIWIYLRIFIEDMELSCDSKAVNGLPLSERKNYASTLIRLSANSEKPFMVSGFGRNNLKLRILNVLNHKSLTKFSIALSILFIITISLVLITNPAQ